MEKLCSFLLMLCLFQIACEDRAHFRISERHLLGLFLSGCVFLFHEGGGILLARRALESAGTCGLLLLSAFFTERRMRRNALGGGDIRLVTVLCLYLGFFRNLRSLLLACLAALVFLSLRKPSGRPPEAFPFAPWLSLTGAVFFMAQKGTLL